jgi:hypothetical protein
MTSRRLNAYLELERQMLALDEAGDPFADVFREVMDPLWYALSDEEHALLDARTISRVAGGPIKTPVGPDMFLTPPLATEVTEHTDPLRVEEWRCVA